MFLLKNKQIQTELNKIGENLEKDKNKIVNQKNVLKKEEFDKLVKNYEVEVKNFNSFNYKFNDTDTYSRISTERNYSFKINLNNIYPEIELHTLEDDFREDNNDILSINNTNEAFNYLYLTSRDNNNRITIIDVSNSLKQIQLQRNIIIGDESIILNYLLEITNYIYIVAKYIQHDFLIFYTKTMKCLTMKKEIRIFYQISTLNISLNKI